MTYGTFVTQKLLFALDNVVEQLSTLHVFHYEEELLGSFDYLVELDYVRVANQLQNVDLTRYPLYVCHIHYLLLLEYFHSHLLPCRDVCRRLHFTKSPLS